MRPPALMGHCLCVHAEQADQHQQDVEPFPGRQGAKTLQCFWQNFSKRILLRSLSMLDPEAGTGSNSPNMGYLT